MECKTYRWCGHHEGDPGTHYRTKEEIAKWRALDPVERLKAEAIKSSNATAADFKNIDKEVEATTRDCAEFALASPQPDISTALKHVFFN